MKQFDDYVKKYDFNILQIKGKYKHSYHVVEAGLSIADALNLNEHDKQLVEISCMFHDIARFKQWTEYQTFLDHKSFDHGDIGVEILKETGIINEFNLSNTDINIVLESIKYHNKYNLENISEYSKIIANILRDADKVCIFEDATYNINYNGLISYNLIDDILNGKMIKNTDCVSSADTLLRMVGWINDLIYEKSFDILFEKQVLNNTINELKKFKNCDLLKINQLEDYIMNYKRGKLQC